MLILELRSPASGMSLDTRRLSLAHLSMTLQEAGTALRRAMAEANADDLPQSIRDDLFIAATRLANAHRTTKEQ